jgi:hypothetical protein
MIEFKGQVTHSGSVVDFTAGPWEFSRWEEYAARHGLTFETAPMTASLYIAYCAVHKAAWPPEVGYEMWAQGVQNIEMEDSADVPPTEKATSEG